MSAGLLAVSVLLAAILPGPERLITPPSFGFSDHEQFPADLAGDGTGFLALWTERVANGEDGLYAVAIRAPGTRPPLPPRLIARGQIFHAHVVWAGDAYLVVWGDTSTRRLLARRLSRDAEPIGELAVVGGGLYPLGLAWNGRRALVVAVADDFRKLVLSLDGNAIVGQLTPLPIPANAASTLTVAAAGDPFVVTWIETIASTSTTSVSTVKAMRFDEHGVSLDAAPATMPLAGDLRNGVSSIGADSDGERVGVAFIVRPADGAGPPWWETLRTVTVDARTMTIAETASRAVVSEVDVLSTPRGFVAATHRWQDGHSVLVLTPFDGSPATEIALDSGANEFLVAKSKGAAMAVWADFHYGRHLFGVALNESATATIGQAAPVALRATTQINPVLAPAGDRALVLWVDRIGPDYGDVMAMRVDNDGNPLDAPFAVALRQFGVEERSPLAIFTGQLWLVAWTGYGQPGFTSISRVSPDGLISDAPDVLETGYALASNGNVTMLASGGKDGLSLTRFSPAGEWLDTLPVGAATRAGSDARLATNGREFLLVWTEQANDQANRDVMALRLDAAGMVLGAPIAVANGSRDEGDAVVTGSEETDFLVLYSVDKSTVRAKWVAHEGYVAEEGVLVANAPLPLAVTRARSGYVAAFSNGNESGTAILSAVQLDVIGAPIGLPVSIAQSESPWQKMSLGVLKGSPVAIYSRSAAGPPFEDVPRLFLRTLFESARRRSVR